MASTSLAEQLRKLATPQTSLLEQHDKKKPSLLFDAKEAATFDRSTLLEISRDGLQELIRINSKFEIFETNLFAQSSLQFERAIQSHEVHEKLNETIRQFLILISPYFLLKSAHQTLEWLISRYRIHEYNKDDFISLILPYHETNIFVRCLQLLNIKNPTDKWHWLYPTQKANVILAKSVVINHCQSDAAFLKFICTETVRKTKELGEDAKALVVEYSFYCTIVMGAIENSKKITEEQVSHLIPSILKGLSSNVADFVASAYMIVALLLLKTKLKEKLLKKFLDKILKVKTADLQPKSCLIMILMFQTQFDILKMVPIRIIEKLSTRTWFIDTLQELTSSGALISPFIIALFTGILKFMLENKTETQVVENLSIRLLQEITLDEKTVNILIRVLLENFSTNDKEKQKRIENWFCALLREIESIYPNIYSQIATLSPDESLKLSENQKSTLNLLMNTKLSDTTLTMAGYNIFDKLCHYDLRQRVDAIKFLTKNYLKLPLKDRQFLKDLLVQRFDDNSVVVINSLLQFSPAVLVDLMGNEGLFNKLLEILARKETYSSKVEIIKLLCSGKIQIVDNVRFFFTLLIYLYPLEEDHLHLAKIIANSDYGKRNPVISKLHGKIENFNGDVNEFQNIVRQEIFSPTNYLSVEQILDYITRYFDLGNLKRDLEYNVGLCLTFMYLNVTVPQNCSPNISYKLVSVLLPFLKHAKLDVKISKLSDVLPDKVCLRVDILKTVVEKTAVNLNEFLFDLTKNDYLLQYLTISYKLLLLGCLSEHETIYTPVFKKFLRKISLNVEEQIKFISNYFYADVLDEKTLAIKEIDKQLQVASLSFVANLISQMEKLQEWLIRFKSNKIISNILFGLMSNCAYVRQETIKLLEVIFENVKNCQYDYSFLLNGLLKRKSEILLDNEQLPLILYTILSPDMSVQKTLRTAAAKQNSQAVLNNFLTLSNNLTKYPIHFIYLMFKMLSLINSKDILELSSVTAFHLIDKCTETLGVYESEIVSNITAKINSDTIENLTAQSNVWKFIHLIFKKYNLVLMQKDATKSVYCIELLLGIFEKDLFEVMSEDLKCSFIKNVIDVGTESDIAEVRSVVSKFFKRIDLHSQYVQETLHNMHEIIICRQNTNTTKRRRNTTNIPSIETISTIEWKRGITALEILQNKKKLTHVELIIPLFFKILKKCLDFEEQTSLEYPKQLVLSCILNCCQKLSPNGTLWTNKDLIPESVFNIELIVQCIRATQNPQTHHHALLVLSHIAGMFPEQVLHHIMSIFTFMGSSVLRHDDSYSFQIITKIIDIIVPILVHKEAFNEDEAESLIEHVTPVLRVFVDVLLDVPVHRRIPLFEKLIKTFGANNSLWIFLILVFESHVLHGEEISSDQQNLGKKYDQIEYSQKRLEIAKTIVLRFEPEIILHSCIQLLQYLKSLPVDKDDNTVLCNYKLFDLKNRTPKQLRHFKYIIITFVSNLLSDSQLIRLIAVLDDEKTHSMEPLYRNFIITVLSYIQNVSKCADKNAGKPQAKYWKVMLHHCFDVLDNINSLLTSDMFLLVIRGLMSHNISTVRRKAMELLNSKLQSQSDYLSEANNMSLLDLNESLLNVIESIGESRDTSEAEDELNQQTALFSMKLLAKRLATDNPEKFRPIFDKVILLLKSKKAQGNVLASLVLCFAELCKNLQIYSLYSLSSFMPVLLKLLAAQKSKDTPDLMLVSVVTAVNKVVETLPKFLNPFLEKLLTEISILSAKWRTDEKNPKTDPIAVKLKLINTKIAESIRQEILVTAIEHSYQKLISKNQLLAISTLMDIFTQSLQNKNFKHVPDEIIDFFFVALQFRSDNADNSDLTQEQISMVEGYVTKSFISLVLKLSESTFRPLYYKLFNWSFQDTEYKDRAITFYRISKDIAESLKGLFILFAEYFLKNAANLLVNCNTIKNENLYFDNEQKCCILIDYILATLHFVFLFDNQNFINKDRFEILMEPIVDQLENTIGGEEQFKQRAEQYLIPCIAQFAVATADDSLWKQLNYHILLKTRHNSSAIRLAALHSVCEMAKKLGEDFLPLLPETIPFMAELLEDEDEKVEKACQKAVQELEKVLGEPLQKYF